MHFHFKVVGKEKRKQLEIYKLESKTSTIVETNRATIYGIMAFVQFFSYIKRNSFSGTHLMD